MTDDELEKAKEIARRVVCVVGNMIGPDGPFDIVQAIYDEVLCELVKQRRDRLQEARGRETTEALRLQESWAKGIWRIEA